MCETLGSIISTKKEKGEKKLARHDETHLYSWVCGRQRLENCSSRPVWAKNVVKTLFPKKPT
jgi:hypothetical protein